MRNVQNYGFLVLFVIIILMAGCQESSATETARPAVQTSAPTVAPEPPGVIESAVPKAREIAAAPVVEGPSILVTKDSHDFGDIGPGSNHVCEYTFKNIGSETLVIDKIQSTCGCSVPQMKKNDYTTGEEGIITVRFHAPNSKGATTKHLYILSNDPKHPRVQLELKATVSVKVAVEPEEASLLLNKPNAGLGPITVKGTDGSQFAITKFTSTNNAIACDFDPKRKASEFVLQPVADPNLLARYPNGVMQIEVDHPQGGILLVRYSAVPRYEVNRPRIILQNAQPGQKEQKEVLVKSNYGETLEIANVSSRLGYMKIVGREIEENALKLTIEINMPDKETATRRYFSDELKITFENEQEVDIRVSGWFKT